jgi:hypothetical protein
MKTLKKTGEKAGAPNARIEFKIPMAKAARLLNHSYGNMTRVRTVVSASFCGSS